MKQTVEIAVPRERVQQRSAGKIEDVPQYPEESVDLVKCVSQERVQRTGEAQFTEKFSRSASRSAHRSSVCQCRRFWRSWYHRNE